MFYKAKLHVIKVFEYLISPKKAQELLDLEMDMFDDNNHIYAIVLNDDVILGINEYVNTVKAGLVIMLKI